MFWALLGSFILNTSEPKISVIAFLAATSLGSLKAALVKKSCGNKDWSINLFAALNASIFLLNGDNLFLFNASFWAFNNNLACFLLVVPNSSCQLLGNSIGKNWPCFDAHIPVSVV